MSRKQRLLAGDDAYALWKRGAVEWNRWARQEGKDWEVLFEGNIPKKEEEGSANFENFVFTGKVNFANATLLNARFKNATFQGEARFNGVQFKSETDFANAQFIQPVSFQHSRFEGKVYFPQTKFKKVCTFAQAQFKEDANFKQTIFSGEATFHKSKFCHYASFIEVLFWREVNFQDAEFFKNCRFESTTFHKSANFPGTVFRAGSQLVDCDFEGITSLGHAQFHADTSFELSTFEMLASFYAARFERQATFRHSKFNGSLDISRAKFLCIPDFRQTALGHHVTLRGATIERPIEFADEDADRLRRLKEMATQSKDHELEQEFFAQEMKAARSTEIPEHLHTQPLMKLRTAIRPIFNSKQFGKVRLHLIGELQRRRLVRLLRLMPNYVYEVFSNFGRSISRPLIGLLATLLAFSGVFQLLAIKEGASWSSAFVYSASLLLPFFGFARNEGRLAREALFGEDYHSAVLSLTGFTEGILGLVFVFLIGLALRNRFRI
ncbi:hypothetical protein PsAD13_04978 [Pseudovibrio sp. Ad13]|uniref:pentapeptide repeat-containing protein n=1 Tax=Pseudovibrio sp. Ad13 TaxID=989396 RepID=UPI0007AE999F|nr:pentapeptide repeat-containing protein [Pseudovibrio sp. Ad13]KZK79987.1 hypothetical protein PsAD13_04978 [Pseudovibrio sp. Ad13]